ncbi:MAG: beta-ketoacyl-ACP reductase [Bacteroidetes bacterium]|nr:MAG: beta-ketoacyl-ACP reductase [Bacteroidota bacterium]
MDTNLLAGQVAIVTGGARGIGKGICKLFCEEGAQVALWDVLDAGEATAEALRAAGGKAMFQKVDVTDKASVEQAVEEVMRQFGRIDILINNAGIVRDRTFLKMTDEEWHQVINVNLNGIYTCTKAVIPHMREAGYGRIVSASSVNGILGAYGQTNYSASKAAIIGFTKALAREVGKYGITVNAVAPGFVKTDMTATIPPEMLKGIEDSIPVRRAGTTEELAHAYLYLASPYAGFTNGHTLSVNGGVIS